MRRARGSVGSGPARCVFHLAAQTFVPDALPYAAGNLRDQRDRHRAARAGRRAIRRRSGNACRASCSPVRPRSTARATPATTRCAKRSARAPANPYAREQGRRRSDSARRGRRPRHSTSSSRARSTTSARGRANVSSSRRFAAQLARIAARRVRPRALVGNLTAARDFLDVRDVVAAYLALARDGDRGEIYNVCSGHAVPIRDVLRELDSRRARPGRSARGSRADAPAESPVSVRR